MRSFAVRTSPTWLSQGLSEGLPEGLPGDPGDPNART